MGTHKSDQSVQELRDINNLRKLMGMPIIKVGYRACLKCEKKFFSENLTINRMCPRCKYNYLDSFADVEIHAPKNYK